MGTIDVAAERAIARLAAAHLGLVAREWLLDAGVRPAAIDDRVRSGRLRVVHPGVYFTAHGELDRMQRHLAAVLACGAGSWAGLDSAAETWRMLAAHPGPSRVLHTGPRRRGPAGVVVRHAGHLPADEVTRHRGVPVTTPARTLLDLAAAGHPGFGLALDEAFALRLVDREQLGLLATSGRRGSVGLRALLREAPGYTRQGAERLLRRLVLRAQLPRPEFNATLADRERDAIWRDLRLVLEVDGYATHGTRRAFAGDRRRDQELAAAGYQSIRFTWHQLSRESEAVIARLAAALAHAGARAAA